jgi:DNA mismatch repair protein MutL
MVSTIQTLSTEIVSLITAGEVIDSLGAVVRELVENSLDAGATRIIICLWPEQWRVRVADNGCGMDADDLQQAALPHSTSKIRSPEDLWKINSLGFRGEALHSLTSVADLEIFSRPPGANIGWRAIYGHDGQPVKLAATAIAPGTVVTVSELFGNCVLRRESLPIPAQQTRAVQRVIQQIALCHPHVTWQVWHNDRQWFTISPAATTGKLLPQILPQVQHSDLQELKLELSDCANSALAVVVGLPDRCHRHRPDWVRVGINRRMVNSPELEQSILSAFHKTLPRDRYPVCLLNLTVPPEQINWNRHPAKHEIYLHNIPYWQKQITQGIDQALRISSAQMSESYQNTRVSQLLKAAEAKGGYNVNAPTTDKDHNTPMPLKAIAQLNNTYIVVEHPHGMWLVEQHIAHERVLYEQICDRWELVPIEPAIIMYQLSAAQVSQLQTIGIDIEPFGDQIWAIRSIPALLQHREDRTEAVLELSWGGDLKTAQVAVACRTAIRNGTPMSLEQMQGLLDQWQQTRNPRTCPHGRPIYLSLDEPALARFFRRSWVIGKSHGI